MRTEDQIQRSICDYLATVAPDVLAYAIPNASRRSSSGRATNAVPGIVSGMPDLALALPGGGRCAFIECKSPRGVLSKDQKAMRLRMIRLGIPCCTARSIDDVRVFLENIGVVTREARAA